MSDLLPPFGAYGHGGWYGEGLVEEDGLTEGGPHQFGSVTVSTLGWEAEGVFAPRPREPVEQPPPVAPDPERSPPSRHRRQTRPAAPAWPRVISSLFGVLTALTVIAVCVMGWILSYDPLRDMAFSRVPRGLSQLWPVVIYGPWLVGCLSVLRAALHGRQLVHSWVVVILFSSLATGLCVAGVSRTASNLIVVGLPPLTAAISLHQLVRQLTVAPRARRPLGRIAAHKMPPRP
ncbi:DUF2637 domain-containing protein [Streptomyces tateyamensis]|nr:DUF2637 domain-containing protein [Streptomyces tateyamensis]